MHLSTAGLARAELDFMTKPLQYANDRFSCLWEESVVIAGDKKRYAQSAPPGGRKNVSSSYFFFVFEA
jgi:hypothetical protein